MTKYPEHEKLHAIKDKSQAIGEFLDWLRSEKGFSFAVPHEHSDETCQTEEGYRCCDFKSGEYVPVNPTIRGLLAEFFDINEAKLEQEKQAMLTELRAGQP